MNLDCFDEPAPSTLTTRRPQGPYLGRRSLPPVNSFGSQHVLPTYPSSTLRYYYPAYHHPSNSAHILPSHQVFQYQYPLPSASQSHIPSLRHTPSAPNINNAHIDLASHSPIPDQ